MAFTPRTRAQIAAEFLAYWSANYAAATPPRVLLTASGSDADLEAQVVGVELEGLEAVAAQVALDILPDQASPDSLERFSYVYNVPRRTGAASQLVIEVTGAAATTTYPIPSGTQVAASSGVLFDVIDTSVTTDAFLAAPMLVRAANPGTSGNLADGDTVTFTVAPSGLSPTGTVASTTSEGTDAEDNASLAQRVIEKMQERPASGNRADWREWVRSYTGTPIVEAYVYPLLQPPATPPGAGTESIPGCVTVVAVGPAQGSNATNTRLVPSVNVRTPGGPLLEVIDYLNGTRDASGAATLTGNRLPPVTMVYGDWTVEAFNTQTQNIVVAITPTASNAFPFASNPALDASSDATHVIVSGNYGAGGIENLSGLSALVYVDIDPLANGVRGGYVRVTLGTGTYDGGTLLTTFPVTGLPRSPITPSFLWAAPPCWAAFQATVFDYFDGLGPGDTTTPARWPTQDVSGRATVYRSALAGRVTEVAGVLSASVTTPAVNVTPAQKTVVTLGTLLITP